MKTKPFLGKAAAVLALLLTALVLQPAQAGAATAAPRTLAAACSHDGCRGLDPQSTGCSASAYTYDSFTAHWGDLVEIRHSTDCGAYWARVTANSDNRPYRTAAQSGRDNGTVVYEQVVSGNCWPNGTGTPCAAVWTPMIAGPLIRVCHNADVLECTRWYVVSMG
ncbi:DUF2690 domain-containing protein [Amycolatopsis tolypomycina]|uniref:DUF2690 domain-containing protein n=1 Tax=Amycolatopsis tolypomycina TaxID=208445 RepID=A0A1H5AIE0_9PSEU|nr:DUF2690 domain-containing protein [Amycolatopsis tolypomycina]SED42143.1 Protein of unknown function [Amycolatopsis tolypomycina]